jgi:O-antigen ligase
MLDFPAWTGSVFSLAGLVLLVLGLMACLGSHRRYRRTWGRRMAFSGGGLFVVGTAFGTFIDLLQYVLG